MTQSASSTGAVIFPDFTTFVMYYTITDGKTVNIWNNLYLKRRSLHQNLTFKGKLQKDESFFIPFLWLSGTRLSQRPREAHTGELGYGMLKHWRKVVRGQCRLCVTLISRVVARGVIANLRYNTMRSGLPCMRPVRNSYAPTFKAQTFFPHYAMQARPMSSCGICLSVCVSVTFVHSVKTNKHIFNFFHDRVTTSF